MFRNFLEEVDNEACCLLLNTLWASSRSFSVREFILPSVKSRFQARLSNKPAVHLRSDAPALCTLLLMQCLPVSKCIYMNFESLKNDKSKLLDAWLEGDCSWLVVVVFSVSITHLPKLGTHVHLIRGGDACKETNFTRVFLFLIYYVYVTIISSLIKWSYFCVLKSLTALLKF
jgi:hypothetical protein